jgi:homoserine kinase
MNSSSCFALSLSVPATSANLGAGFDTMGMALTLYNTFHFTPAEQDSLQTTPASPEPFAPLSGEALQTNILFTTLDWLYARHGLPRPACQVTVEAAVPLARGLGSSATAVVAALLAANQWLDQPHTTADLLTLATEVEGHPDNVVPALMGGVCWSNGTLHRSIDWPADWGVCALVPAYPVKTNEARQVLPNQYTRSQIVDSLRQSGLLCWALATHDIEALKVALAHDVVHQPYRAKLIPEFEPLRAALLADTEALGLIISGSGPTLLMVYPAAEQPAMADWLTRQPYALRPLWLSVDTRGAWVH